MLVRIVARVAVSLRALIGTKIFVSLWLNITCNNYAT